MANRNDLVKTLTKHQKTKQKLTDKLGAYAAVILPGIDNTYNLGTSITPMATHSIPMSAQIGMPGASLLLNLINIIPSSITAIREIWNNEDPKYTFFHKAVDIAFNLFMITLTVGTGVIGILTVLEIGGVLLALSAAGIGVFGAALGLSVLGYESFKAYLGKKALATPFENRIVNRREVFNFLKAWLWDKTISGNVLQERETFEALCDEIDKGIKKHLTPDEKTKFHQALEIRKIELEEKYKRNRGNQSIWSKLAKICKILDQEMFEEPEKARFIKLLPHEDISFEKLKRFIGMRNTVIFQNDMLYYVDYLHETVTKIESHKVQDYVKLIEDIHNNVPDETIIKNIEALKNRTLYSEPLRYYYADRDRLVYELGHQLQEYDALSSISTPIVMIKFDGDIHEFSDIQSKMEGKDAIFLDDTQTMYYANHKTKQLVKIRAPEIDVENVSFIKKKIQEIVSKEVTEYAFTYIAVKRMFTESARELRSEEEIASINAIRKYSIFETIQETLVEVKQVEGVAEKIAQPIKPLRKKNRDSNLLLGALGINSGLAFTGLIIAIIGLITMFFTVPPSVPVILGGFGIGLAAFALIKFGYEHYLNWKDEKAFKLESDKVSLEVIYEAENVMEMKNHLQNGNPLDNDKKIVIQQALPNEMDIQKDTFVLIEPIKRAIPDFKVRLNPQIEEYEAKPLVHEGAGRFKL